MLSDLGAFLDELKRRKVFRVAVVYAAVAFVVVQVADLSFDALQIPPWAYPLVLLLALIGFPIALVLAWAFETRPEVPRATAPEKEAEVASDDPGPAAAPRSSRPEADRDEILDLPPGPSIAVLPFSNLSGDESQELFAHAMTNDIVAGLTECSTLFVVSTGAGERRETEEIDPVTLGRKLGVRYVLRGSVNRIGPQLRITARLTDTTSNVQMWSGNYDRELKDATGLFDVQDDIREQIVSTLSDFHGVIYSAETSRNIHRSTESLTAYECLSVALAYDKYLSEEYHLRARESLERAVELDPGFDPAWAHLSWIYTDEYVFGYNPLPDPMGRALSAARRAIKLAPTNYHNRWLLSRVHYFSGERDLFFAEAEKSLKLNSSDGTTIGLIGGYMVLAGVWERGAALIEKAKLLNPRHPDYYYLFLGVGELARGNDGEALTEFHRVATPEFPLALILLAATSALTGRAQEAARYWRQLVGLRPDMNADGARTTLERMLPYQPALVDRVVEALRAIQP